MLVTTIVLSKKMEWDVAKVAVIEVFFEYWN